MKYFVYNQITFSCDTFTDIIGVAEYLHVHRNTISNKFKTMPVFGIGSWIIGPVVVHKSKRHNSASLGTNA